MSRLPKGVYDQLITASLRAEIESLPRTLKPQVESLSPQDAVEYLAREIAVRLKNVLVQTRDKESDDVFETTNDILSRSGFENPVEAALLKSVHDAITQRLDDPVIPLSQSALVTNQQGLNYHR